MRALVLSISFAVLCPAFAFAESSVAVPAASAAKAAVPMADAVATAPATPAAVIKPQVKFTTTMGDIIIELESERAPKSVANFLMYVKAGQYNDTVFHRVIPTFMIQGGGYTKDLSYKSTLDPIENEASNGLSNLRGTVAMARQDDPNSATTQFFINVVDNKFLNYTLGGSPGYAVFARVISGMDVVDKIRAVKTDSITAGFADKPLEPVIIQTAVVFDPNAEAKPIETKPIETKPVDAAANAAKK